MEDCFGLVFMGKMKTDFYGKLFWLGPHGEDEDRFLWKTVLIWSSWVR
jgi:hypothetical protein